MNSLISEELQTNSFVGNMFWKSDVFWKHNLFSTLHGRFSWKLCVTAHLPAFPECSEDKPGFNDSGQQKQSSFKSLIWPIGIRTEERSQAISTVTNSDAAQISPVLHML